jgi:ankyrin repeat protein
MDRDRRDRHNPERMTEQPQRRQQPASALRYGDDMSDLPHALIGDFIDAVVQDRDRAARLLAAHPELLNARWIHDESALHFLAIEGFLDGVTFLAERGAAIDATNEFGDTALIDVCVLQNTEMAAVLLRFGANPNAMSRTRDNLLHAAVEAGDATLVTLLLDAGADPEYVSDWGTTIFDAVSNLGPEREAISAILTARGIVQPGD